MKGLAFDVLVLSELGGVNADAGASGAGKGKDDHVRKKGGETYIDIVNHPHPRRRHGHTSTNTAQRPQY